jgi:ketosteroid isomerase-like protein
MSTVATDPREGDRQTLRAILRDIEEGINRKDLGKILPHLSEDAIVTYQNAEVTAGKQRISEYFEKHLLGTHPLIRKFTIHGEVAAPAVFYGDTAVAHGTTRDEMELAVGKKFKLDGRLPALFDQRAGQLRFTRHEETLVGSGPRRHWFGRPSGLAFFGVVKIAGRRPQVGREFLCDSRSDKSISRFSGSSRRDLAS